MKVRRAVPEDAHAIADVEVTSWRAAYRHLMPAAFLDGLSTEEKASTWAADIAKHGPTGRKRVLVAEEDSTIIGFSRAGIPSATARGAGASSDAGLLYLLYVVPEAWGTGVARAVMLKVMEDVGDLGVSRAYLWVLRDNHRARRSYERLGWLPDGETTSDDYGGTWLEALRYQRAVP